MEPASQLRFPPSAKESISPLNCALVVIQAQRGSRPDIYIYVAVSGNLHSQLVVAVSGRTCRSCNEICFQFKVVAAGELALAMATAPRSLDTISLCSTVSSCPDRNGFYGGFQRTDKPKEPLSKAQIIAREKKWLYMIDNWSIYMSKNYKKVILNLMIV